MAWLLASALILLTASFVLLARAAGHRRARRGWARWEAQRRSGALAWSLFRRRARTLRLTDRRER